MGIFDKLLGKSSPETQPASPVPAPTPASPAAPSDDAKAVSASAPVTKVRFDHVSIEKAGGHNLITAEEFLAIGLQERVHLIVQQKVQFIRDGQVIPAREAFKTD